MCYICIDFPDKKKNVILYSVKFKSENRINVNLLFNLAEN